MAVLADIIKGIERGRERYEWAVKGNPDMATSFDYVEKHMYNDWRPDSPDETKNQKRNELALGDNLLYMKVLLENGYGGMFKALYIDPPFFTKAKYNASVSIETSDGRKHSVHHLAYDDRFDRNLEYYIENMTARLLLMKDLLSEEGLIWVHLDWHSSHYIKLVMDEIFGEKNFVNEIIWSYKSGGSGKKHFARKHDTILVYGKSERYSLKVPEEKSYNRGLKPYHFKGVEEYKDDYGWYTLVNMKDVWSIDMVGRTSAERTGYATQKPLELMKRIIEASSEEGDLVGDFFSGSGSFLEAAELLGRKWVGCDNEELATAMAKKRLDLIEADYTYLAEDRLTLRLGRLEIKEKQREALENGKYLFCCEISSFEPEIETGYIQLNDRKYIDEVLINDTKQLIDYVMIDPDYRSGFSCEIVVEKDFDNIRFISGGQFAMVVVDVFGREYFIKGLKA